MQEKEHKITARIRVFLDVGPRSVKMLTHKKISKIVIIHIYQKSQI